MQQLTEKGDKVIVGLWVMILMVGMTAVIVGELGQDTGYVGGVPGPDGSVIGGHPSEAQMIKDREAAGVSVTVTESGKRIFSGANAVQFAVMDKRGDY